MDRLFLQGLVRELEPTLVGSTIRDVGQLTDGFFVSVFARSSTPTTGQLAFGLRADSPSLALFAKHEALPGIRSQPPLRKRLVGSVVSCIWLSESDRVLRMDLTRRRASGRSQLVNVFVEWIGPTSAAYVVETESDRIVDYVSLGRARQTRGEHYVLPQPPQRKIDLCDQAKPFEVLVHALDGASQSDARALKRAGVAPLIASEISFRTTRSGDSLEAVTQICAELAQPRPQLWLRSRRGPSSSSSPIHRVATFSLTHAQREFDPVPVEGYNDALRRGLEASSRWARSRVLYLRLSRVLKKEHRRLERLRKKLEDEYAQTKDVARLRRLGELLLAGHEQATLGAADERGRRDAIVDNLYEGGGPIRISIDPRFSLVQNAERFFKQASRQDRRRNRLDGRVEACRHELEFVETLRWTLDEAADEGELASLQQEAFLSPRLARALGTKSSAPKKEGARKKSPRRLSPRRFRTSSGMRILAGKSSISNAEVSFRLALPNDYWFHVLGMPGAHVILRVDPNRDPQDADFEEAAALAAHFSRARDSSFAEVMMTRARHVAKIRGAPPGTVRVAEYRSLRVAPLLLERDSKDTDDD